MNINIKAITWTVPFVLLFFGTLVYFYFWPRFQFTVYGYHTYKATNEHSSWLIYLDESGPELPEADFSKWWIRVYPPIEKGNTYGSPYFLNISHDHGITIRYVEIVKSEQVIYKLTELQRIVHEKSILTRCGNIELDYENYDLVIHYIFEGHEDAVEHIFILKVPLETDFVEKKVSMFEIGLGI